MFSLLLYLAVTLCLTADEKTEADKMEETQLLHDLVAVVNERDELVNQTEEERLRFVGRGSRNDVMRGCCPHLLHGNLMMTHVMYVVQKSAAAN